MGDISRREAISRIAGGSAVLGLGLGTAAAAKDVDAFMQNVNWEEVNRRAEALSKM